MVSGFLWAVQVSAVEACNDAISVFQTIDLGADLNNLASSVGARDRLGFDGEETYAISDGQVSVVESETSDFEEVFVGVDGWDGLGVLFDVVAGASGSLRQIYFALYLSGQNLSRSNSFSGSNN
ncbi:hypothetical protein BP6252_14032 [Coleophoma cylindrospora]|uniref:Uncharacterized protein n=1 Tax=Coleophoma cylindrospora TaxID=1849047 RepID=A0A3D8Q4F0_9HELO|nr:hypothetical protein BP6252_14032 [Coleophoma cylindrospora]